MNSIQATREYRSKLSEALAHARRTLPTREFAIVATGLNSEINRLDRELENLQLRAFMGLGEGTPLFPRIAQFVQRTCSQFQIEEEGTVSTVCFDKRRVRNIPLSSVRPNGEVIPESPTLSMGASFAHYA